jgi:hypothetical protein
MMNACFPFFKVGESISGKKQQHDFSSVPGLILMFFAITLLLISCNTSEEYVPKAKQRVPQKACSYNIGDVKLLNTW